MSDLIARLRAVVERWYDGTRVEMNNAIAWDISDATDKLESLERELAELRAQQPVAWRYQPTGAGAWGHSEERPAVAGVDGWTVQPLYAAQQPKAE